jgi:CBS domain-containing protein
MGDMDTKLRVQDCMSVSVVHVGTDHTLHEAAKIMTEHGVGSAVITDPDGQGYGIISERDITRVVAAGNDPEKELVKDHMLATPIFAESAWSVDLAAETMVDQNFRHLIVVDGGQVAGILSMKDIVACWTHRPDTGNGSAS